MRQTLSVGEAAKQLGIGRNLAYRLAAQGRIPALRLGNRLVIPRVALDRVLSEPEKFQRGVESRCG